MKQDHFSVSETDFYKVMPQITRLVWLLEGAKPNLRQVLLRGQAHPGFHPLQSELRNLDRVLRSLPIERDIDGGPCFSSHGKDVGCSMKHTFHIATKQAARLARVEPHVLYQARARNGHWRGIAPTKLPNGRLLWRGDHIAEVAGIIPNYADQTPGERALITFLEQQGFPVTAEYWNLGRTLLDVERDPCADPADLVGEARFVTEIVVALCTRVECSLPAIDDVSKRRVIAALGLIASQATSFTGVGDE
ncbi:hypothetical protein GPA22_09595 [Aromatoleum toluvorans]|uniref:Type ISP restriction-modification enzyme LLaBIII C-terminal specificity domain-containing protein n=1 Tax=Aromatoleum toluvorans TaxID=92002 RepID=A0ABX1PZB4_9RHOO|nr:hypothetical protein [Aromatoleum toluvorans]NMG43980.1 hypothetical protein [Aromatoleum toluvorans]